MTIFKSNVSPNQVFNPRGEYNSEMYVKRPEYEIDFESALESDLCILVHGQSGTGKTWLTRRMLEQEDIYYKIVNLATASIENSIYSCFRSIMAREHWEIRVSRTETIAAEIKIPIAGSQLESSSIFDNSVDYFMEFLKFMQYRVRNKAKKRYIVFENMEAILDNDELIKQLANLITLIDDEEVAKYKTKFIIIGATKDIHQYFRKATTVNTIDNRLYELPDIGTLTVKQAKELMRRGFEKLEINFASADIKNDCIEEYTRVTGAIPQRIHELCLSFSQIVRRYGTSVGCEQVNEGIKRWVKTSLNKNYAYISRLLEKNDNVSIKNKVLYCIAQMDELYFCIDDINEELNKEFPVFMKTCTDSSQSALDEFSQCNPPLLNKTEDVFGEYSFVDFKCALCLRVILLKKNEKVLKNNSYDYF